MGTLSELSLYNDKLIRLLEGRRRWSPKARDAQERLRNKIQNYIGSDLRQRTVRRIQTYGLSSPEVVMIDTERSLILNLAYPELKTLAELGAKHGLDLIVRQLGRPIIFGGSREWLDEHAIRFSKNLGLRVSETMNEEIRSFLSTAIEKGLSTEETIHEMLKFWKDQSEYRAEMVARTETRHSLVASEVEMQKRLGITQYDWDGCHLECPQCGPFILGNPHSAEEIQTFNAEVHPNCIGGSNPVIPDDFEPEVGF
jgi:hypothetical protein